MDSMIFRQEERSRYEALALISEQNDPEMALDLLLGSPWLRWLVVHQIHASHKTPPSSLRLLALGSSEEREDGELEKTWL